MADGPGTSRFGSAVLLTGIGIPLEATMSDTSTPLPDDPNYHTARDQAAFVSREALAAAGVISAGLIEQLLTP